MNEKTDRKEYMKKWQQDNKEKTRENAKRYYYKNIDKIKEKRQSREYKEKYRKYKREWARENRKAQKEIINNLQSKIDKVIELCETEKKYTYGDVRRDENTGKLIYGNKIELDVVNKSKILDILKEDK